MFTDENYDLFVNESLEVFKKYKTRCNPKNKKLVFYTSKCDGSFKNKYTHGGYECGDDGLWTTKCVPSYCDIGYIFDYTKNKCIYDICSGFERKEEEEEEEKEKKEEKGNNNNNNTNDNVNVFKYVLIPLIVVALIIGIVIIIIICKRAKLKKTEINKAENIGLTEVFTE